MHTMTGILIVKVYKREGVFPANGYSPGNKSKFFLKVMPTWSPDKGNMATIPVPTPHGVQKIENFQFWYSLFPDESLSPEIMYMVWNKQLGHNHTALKNPPPFPLTRTEIYFH